MHLNYYKAFPCIKGSIEVISTADVLHVVAFRECELWCKQQQFVSPVSGTIKSKKVAAELGFPFIWRRFCLYRVCQGLYISLKTQFQTQERIYMKFSFIKEFMMRLFKFCQWVCYPKWNPLLLQISLQFLNDMRIFWKWGVLKEPIK